MAPRPYRMSRRAESAQETRRRIIEATAALHREKGVAATTFRDIAQRADVGIGTVYHHFPTYEHVINACGEHSVAASKPPRIETLRGIADPADRIRTLVHEVFAFYERLPEFGAVRSERRDFASLEEWFRQEEAQRRALIDEAVRGVRAGSRARALIFSLVDFSVYESLVSNGLSRDGAVDEITNVIFNRLNLRSRQ